jgi:mersacidin/lichenicidin family type 2 lantibiotic
VVRGNQGQRTYIQIAALQGCFFTFRSRLEDAWVSLSDDGAAIWINARGLERQSRRAAERGPANVPPLETVRYSSRTVLVNAEGATLMDVIRAWKDPEYRKSLSEADRMLLPAHPAGLVELTDGQLDQVGGGSGFLGCVVGGLIGLAVAGPAGAEAGCMIGYFW